MGRSAFRRSRHAARGFPRKRAQGLLLGRVTNALIYSVLFRSDQVAFVRVLVDNPCVDQVGLSLRLRSGRFVTDQVGFVSYHERRCGKNGFPVKRRIICIMSIMICVVGMYLFVSAYPISRNWPY